MKLFFQKITDNYPYNILLLADETIDAINKYLFSSEVYIVKTAQDQLIGIFCLQEITATMIEIKNIAVVETHQGKGIGSQIISYIKDLCIERYIHLLVGTPDCAIRQINFYQKNGFIKFLIRQNFFTNNYPHPIMENGVHLKDMLVLKYDLKAY